MFGTVQVMTSGSNTHPDSAPAQTSPSAPGGEAPKPRGGSVFNDRPKRTYVTGPVTKGLRIVALGITGVTLIGVVVGYAALPDEIATHFNVQGEADAWGSKSSIIWLTAMFVAMVGGLTWLSHHPRVFNYPTEITEMNAQRLYRVGEQMMVGVNVSLAITFAGLVVSSFFDVNSSWFMVPAMVSMFVSIIVAFARILRASWA